jgi:hypothetical protein
LCSGDESEEREDESDLWSSTHVGKEKVTLTFFMLHRTVADPPGDAQRFPTEKRNIWIKEVCHEAHRYLHILSHV